MKNCSVLAAALLAAATATILAGCTSSSISSTSTGTKTPTAVNTPATPKESAAAAKNDNKCVNDVAWMTFDDGKPATRTLEGTCESVIVFGNKGNLTLEKVGTVTVMGDNNTVAVDSASKIDFEGTHNTVTFSGSKPQILEAGTNNTLTAKSS